MTKSEFEARVLPLIEEFLRTMPALWPIEDNCENAWDNLVEICPDHEPGMGIWDQIQAIIRDWITTPLEAQPQDDLRQYWEDRTTEGKAFDKERAEAEENGAEAFYPPDEKLCADIARVLISDVLLRAEHEGDRRLEEKYAFESMWDEPRETLEMLVGFFEAKQDVPDIDDLLRSALAQWIEVCSAIPFQWPAASPTLSLCDTEAGALRLRLSYDGSRLELWAARPATDLFIPSSEWERSFLMSAAEVDSTDYNEHCEQIATLDFIVSLESDLP